MPYYLKGRWEFIEKYCIELTEGFSNLGIDTEKNQWGYDEAFVEFCIQSEGWVETGFHEGVHDVIDNPYEYLDMRASDY